MTTKSDTTDILRAISDRADEIVGIDPRSRIRFDDTKIIFYRHGPTVARALGTTYEVVGDDEVVAMRSVEDVEETLSLLRRIDVSSKLRRENHRRDRITGRVVEEYDYYDRPDVGSVIKRLDGDRRVVSVREHVVTEAENDCDYGHTIYFVTLEYVDAAERLRDAYLS